MDKKRIDKLSGFLATRIYTRSDGSPVHGQKTSEEADNDLRDLATFVEERIPGLENYQKHRVASIKSTKEWNPGSGYTGYWDALHFLLCLVDEYDLLQEENTVAQHEIVYYYLKGKHYVIYLDGEIVYDSRKTPTPWCKILFERITEKWHIPHRIYEIEEKDGLLPNNDFPPSLAALEEHIKNIKKVDLRKQIEAMGKQLAELEKKLASIS